MWALGEVGAGRQAGRQADGQGLPRPVHSGWADSRAEKKTRRQGNQSETNRFPLEVRKSRCCGCWWPVRLQATSISARPYSAGCQRPAFVMGPAVGLLLYCLASLFCGRAPSCMECHADSGCAQTFHEGACANSTGEAETLSWASSHGTEVRGKWSLTCLRTSRELDKAGLWKCIPWAVQPRWLLHVCKFQQ